MILHQTPLSGLVDGSRSFKLGALCKTMEAGKDDSESNYAIDLGHYNERGQWWVYLESHDEIDKPLIDLLDNITAGIPRFTATPISELENIIVTLGKRKDEDVLSVMSFFVKDETMQPRTKRTSKEDYEKIDMFGVF